MQIGKQLDQALRKHKMTQADLADMLKVRPQSVSQWITGKTVPKHKNRKKIEKILNIIL